MRRAAEALRTLQRACGGVGCQLLPTAETCAAVSQVRQKITVKTTTKSQRFTIAIKPTREAAIRDYWETSRGVTDLACLHRFANFARIYPRYRDLDYLQAFMPQWDSAIDRLIAHDRGMFPANELARKHPFILNCKLEPLRWAKLAVRGRLPLYTWKEVLRDLKRNTGTEESCVTAVSGRHIKFREPNKAWRTPGSQHAPAAEGGAGDSAEGSGDEADDDMEWLRGADASRREYA